MGNNPSVLEQFTEAVRSNLPSRVESLLEQYGHDEAGKLQAVNFRNKEGRTPLIIAAAKNSPTLAKLLLSHGADAQYINPNRGSEGSALHEATKRGHDAMVELLLQAGASPFCCNAHQRTSMDLAAAEGHANILHRFIQQALFAAPANIKSTGMGGLTQAYKRRYFVVLQCFPFTEAGEAAEATRQLWIFKDTTSSSPRVRLKLDGASAYKIGDQGLDGVLRLHTSHPQPGGSVYSRMDRGYCLFVRPASPAGAPETALPTPMAIEAYSLMLSLCNGSDAPSSNATARSPTVCTASPNSLKAHVPVQHGKVHQSPRSLFQSPCASGAPSPQQPQLSSPQHPELASSQGNSPHNPQLPTQGNTQSSSPCNPQMLTPCNPQMPSPQHQPLPSPNSTPNQNGVPIKAAARKLPFLHPTKEEGPLSARSCTFQGPNQGGALSVRNEDGAEQAPDKAGALSARSRDGIDSGPLQGALPTRSRDGAEQGPPQGGALSARSRDGIDSGPLQGALPTRSRDGAEQGPPQGGALSARSRDGIDSGPLQGALPTRSRDGAEQGPPQGGALSARSRDGMESGPLQGVWPPRSRDGAEQAPPQGGALSARSRDGMDSGPLQGALSARSRDGVEEGPLQGGLSSRGKGSSFMSNQSGGLFMSNQGSSFFNQRGVPGDLSGASQSRVGPSGGLPNRNQGVLEAAATNQGVFGVSSGTRPSWMPARKQGSQGSLTAVANKPTGWGTGNAAGPRQWAASGYSASGQGCLGTSSDLSPRDHRSQEPSLGSTPQDQSSKHGAGRWLSRDKPDEQAAMHVVVTTAARPATHVATAMAAGPAPHEASTLGHMAQPPPHPAAGTEHGPPQNPALYPPPPLPTPSPYPQPSTQQLKADHKHHAQQANCLVPPSAPNPPETASAPRPPEAASAPYPPLPAHQHSGPQALLIQETEQLVPLKSAAAMEYSNGMQWPLNLQQHESVVIVRSGEEAHKKAHMSPAQAFHLPLTKVGMCMEETFTKGGTASKEGGATWTDLSCTPSAPPLPLNGNMDSIAQLPYTNSTWQATKDLPYAAWGGQSEPLREGALQRGTGPTSLDGGPQASHGSPREGRRGDGAFCVICLRAAPNAGFLHGTSLHHCVCMECSKLVPLGTPCPMCREPVERVIGVF